MQANKQTNKGLVAHWSFEEGKGKTTRDRVTSKEDPISYVFNEAEFALPREPQWRNGVGSGALLFDGYSTWVSREAAGAPAIRDALTITAWVAPRCYEWGDEERLSAIVNQHDRERREGYVLGMYRHGAWSLQIGCGDRWEAVWSKDAVLVKNRWSFVTAVFDGSRGIMKLFLNGEAVASRPLATGTTIAPSSEDLWIGKNNRCTVLAGSFELNMFSGLIGEVKLYDRALDDSEIAGSYASEVLPFGGEPPAIRYEDIRLDREPLKSDRHRPQYHLSPPANWMNEPHAPIYFNGQYHLFYQHNPQGPYWHQIHWGHWVSDDLVYWRDLPVALAPEKDAVDPDGVWSGSAAYDEDDLPALFFTAGDDSAKPNQRVGLARCTYAEDGDNDLVHWTKHPEPLIVQERGIGRYGDFRDPFVWKEDDRWCMLIGSGTEDGDGTALAYTSDDMMNWTYEGRFYQADMERYPYLGPIWELPVLLPLGTNKKGDSKHLFLISPVGPGADVEVFYWIGTLDKQKLVFIPDHEEPQMIDVGEFHFTGPSGMVDPRTGRKLVFTIAQGERTPELDYKSGWAHNGGLPISVFLREDGKLGIEPIEELQSLRGRQLTSIRNRTIAETNELLRDVQGDMLEIRMELETEDTGRIGIKVRRSPEGEEETLIFYDRSEAMLGVDRTRTTLDPRERSGGVQGGRLDLEGANLKLIVYLDRSMIEAYANGLKSLTTRAYPSRTDALGLQVWGDGLVTVKSLDVWEMQATW